MKDMRRRMWMKKMEKKNVDEGDVNG